MVWKERLLSFPLQAGLVSTSPATSRGPLPTATRNWEGSTRGLYVACLRRCSTCAWTRGLGLLPVSLGFASVRIHRTKLSACVSGRVYLAVGTRGFSGILQLLEWQVLKWC